MHLWYRQCTTNLGSLWQALNYPHDSVLMLLRQVREISKFVIDEIKKFLLVIALPCILVTKKRTTWYVDISKEQPHAVNVSLVFLELTLSLSSLIFQWRPQSCPSSPLVLLKVFEPKSRLMGLRPSPTHTVQSRWNQRVPEVVEEISFVSSSFSYFFELAPQILFPFPSLLEYRLLFSLVRCHIEL